MNKRPGEEVEFEMDGAKKRYRIDSIEVCQPMPAPTTPAGASAALEPAGAATTQ
jgi:hypothetical protein